VLLGEGVNGDLWKQGTDSASRVKFDIVKKTETPKAPKRVGCGEDLSPAPQKIVQFLSSISEMLCIQKKETEQYNKPRQEALLSQRDCVTRLSVKFCN